MPESLLDQYRQIVAAQPEATDEWFIACLEKCHGGDVAARNEISGAFLRVALSVAEERIISDSEEESLALIQEANAALQEAIAVFAGGTSIEFATFADKFIRETLNRTGFT